jgi:hypothetical protein
VDVNGESNIIYPEKGVLKKAIYLIKYHFHAILYFYIWFGVFVCGLVAPQERVAELGSAVITRGWHISALSMAFILPWPVIYVLRFVLAKKDT